MSPQVKTPEQREKERQQAAAQFVGIAFDDAYALAEELHDPETGLLARRKANRDQLRQLAAQGLLTDDQVGELDEIYPARRRVSDEAEAEGEPNGQQAA